MTIGTRIKTVAARMPWSRRRNKALRPVLYCSFCGKSSAQVQKLIAGPAVFICDACVGLCNTIIGSPDTSPGELPKIERLDTLPTEQLLHRLRIQGTIFEYSRTGMQEIVDTLRQREVSWATIGEALGVSRQAAWDRFA